MARQDTSRRFEVDTGTLVLRRDPDAPSTWVVELDGRRQSHVDLDDPTHLGFDYMRRIGHVLDTCFPAGEPIMAVHLGGGGLTLPRYVGATRPGSRQRVFEIDAALTDVVRRELPLQRSWAIRVGSVDALTGLQTLPPDSADVIVADVFASGRVPDHLAGAAVAAAAARVLRARGVYVLNVVDTPDLPLVTRILSWITKGLDETALLLPAAKLRAGRTANVVVVAGRTPLPLVDLRIRLAADRSPGRVAVPS